MYELSPPSMVCFTIVALLLTIAQQVPFCYARMLTRTYAPPSAELAHTTANIAFFLQISNETLGHLPRLLARIYHPQNIYGVHLDAKIGRDTISEQQKYIYKQNAQYIDNVFFMKSEHITYRGISMVLNTIDAINFLLRKGANWDYFMNLSGSDYPLVSAQFIRHLLTPYMKASYNFISYSHARAWSRNVRYRMQNFHVDEALSFNSSSTSMQQLRHINPLASSLQLQYTNAEAWMINSRQFCDYVVHSGFARKLLVTFAFSVDASEHYFSTLIWNEQRFNNSVVPHAMRQVYWRMNGKFAGQHPYFVDWRASNASAFMFETRVRESPKLFVRKFKYADSALMDMIDARRDEMKHMARVKGYFTWMVNKALTKGGKQ